MKRAPLIDQTARCVPTARRRGGAVAIGDDPFLHWKSKFGSLASLSITWFSYGSEGRVAQSISRPKPPSQPRTPALKAGVLHVRERLGARDRLSAGGRWIRTFG